MVTRAARARADALRSRTTKMQGLAKCFCSQIWWLAFIFGIIATAHAFRLNHGLISNVFAAKNKQPSKAAGALLYLCNYDPHRLVHSRFSLPNCVRGSSIIRIHDSLDSFRSLTRFGPRRFSCRHLEQRALSCPNSIRSPRIGGEWGEYREGWGECRGILRQYRRGKICSVLNRRLKEEERRLKNKQSIFGLSLYPRHFHARASFLSVFLKSIIVILGTFSPIHAFANARAAATSSRSMQRGLEVVETGKRLANVFKVRQLTSSALSR